MEEIYRLMDINVNESVYKLTDGQKNEIGQAWEQIKTINCRLPLEVGVNEIW
jgi:hypothetical protein